MKSQLVCLCTDSISLWKQITHTPRVRGQGTLSDCLTVGATNRSTLQIFVQVVQNVAHCIGGTLNQSQRGGRGAAAAKGPGQEVGGASHGPGHLSKVNKRVDNWARRWSLRAVSEARRGIGAEVKRVQESGPSKGISCERSDLISLLNNGATKWQQISFMAQASSAVTRQQARDGPPLYSRRPFLSFTHELQQIALRRHAKVALSLMHCTGIR